MDTSVKVASLPKEGRVLKPRSRVFSFRVKGPFACFTRLEARAHKLSYDVMTPSAARGIAMAILWKPSIAWHIKRIHVLAPIQFRDPLLRNELRTLYPKREPYFASEDRTQRMTTCLRDVDYVVECYFEMTDKAYPDDSVEKFTVMFERRLGKGQYFHPPYLGMREFMAAVSPVDETTPPPLPAYREIPIPLGRMLLEPGPDGPITFEAELDGGTLVEKGKDSLPAFSFSGA